MFSLKNVLIKFKFPLSRVNVKVANRRKVLVAVRCFHSWTDFDITLYKF